MAKKEQYCLGDIFKLPLGGGVFGIGRILIIQSPSLFVGFYKLALRNGDRLDVETLRDQEYLIKILCGDLGFTKREWESIGNIPLIENICLPLFWGREPLSNGLYLRKYNPPEASPLNMTGFKDRPTTEEEIKREGAQPDGLSGWKAAEAKLKYYLEKAGLL